MKKLVLALLLICFIPMPSFAVSDILREAVMRDEVERGVIRRPGGVILDMRKSSAYRKQLEAAFDKKYCKGSVCNYGVGAYQREVLEPYYDRGYETFLRKPDGSCVWLDANKKEYKCTARCELMELPPQPD